MTNSRVFTYRLIHHQNNKHIIVSAQRPNKRSYMHGRECNVNIVIDQFYQVTCLSNKAKKFSISHFMMDLISVFAVDRIMLDCFSFALTKLTQRSAAF